MFEYEFVPCRSRFEGASMSVAPVREMVEAKACEGWRLVQVLVLNPAAIPSQYELIFERPRTSDG